jgi:hypothetical protein
MRRASAAQRSAGGNAGRKKAGQKRRQQLSRLEGTTVRSAAFSPAAPPRLPSPPTPKVWRQLEHRAELASRPAAGNQEHGADTTDEPDLTSTLRGSNPQRFAARGGDNRLATLNSDEDEQDVDDATPKHLDPRSRIGAIAERMLSLHILAFAVRYRARRYA